MSFQTALPDASPIRGERNTPEGLSAPQGRRVTSPEWKQWSGSRILPVNYVLVNDSVIFRTVPGGEISHHALSSICAFEIDETDEFFESGWSVVVVGRLQLATEDDFAQMLYGKLPEPWAGGNRPMFVRLPCEQVSGRRVIGHGR
jgi:hypothetical protein